MTAYYNEFDPYAAQWLRNLIAAGHIAPGIVDERSIVDVHPDDLIGFTQCHFFAGLGGWSRALRLAGWPDDRPVWTGSPPCQPFSTAGKQLGVEDERHLAPVWLELVSQCLPPNLFGEQVAAAIKKDKWLDDLQDHLEAEGYATGQGVLPACSVGSPHIRQRLWLVAERLADTDDSGSQRREGVSECSDQRAIGSRSVVGGLADTERAVVRGSGLGAIGATQGRVQEANGKREWVRSDHWAGGTTMDGARCTCSLNEFWRDADWLYCRDEKWRPVEPGTFPLANGVPARVGRLRAYGNAIVPQVAAQIISAYMSVVPVTEPSFL